MMKKTKKQLTSVLNKLVLNSSIWFDLLISTTGLYNILMDIIFKRIYVLMTNKLKSSQVKYLCVNDK